jgi:hypothetical protein
MDRETADLVTRDVIPVIRVVMREAIELRAAVQLLADRVETLTAEIAGGELRELVRLVDLATRALVARNGGKA